MEPKQPAVKVNWDKWNDAHWEELCERVETLSAENSLMRTALKFYADLEGWDQGPKGHPGVPVYRVARDALASLKTPLKASSTTELGGE